MSRPIAESLSLLSETLGNCKTNLAEKKVTDVDNIKISDVDEKIAEIQAGGGEADYSELYSKVIAKVEVSPQSTDNYVELKFREIQRVNSDKIKIRITGTQDIGDYNSVSIYFKGKAYGKQFFQTNTVVFEDFDIGSLGGTQFGFIFIQYDADPLYVFCFGIEAPYWGG